MKAFTSDNSLVRDFPLLIQGLLISLLLYTTREFFGVSDLDQVFEAVGAECYGSHLWHPQHDEGADEAAGH